MVLYLVYHLSPALDLNLLVDDLLGMHSGVLLIGIGLVHVVRLEDCWAVLGLGVRALLRVRRVKLALQWLVGRFVAQVRSSRSLIDVQCKSEVLCFVLVLAQILVEVRVLLDIAQGFERLVAALAVQSMHGGWHVRVPVACYVARSVLGLAQNRAVSIDHAHDLLDLVAHVLRPQDLRVLGDTLLQVVLVHENAFLEHQRLLVVEKLVYLLASLLTWFLIVKLREILLELLGCPFLLEVNTLEALEDLECLKHAHSALYLHDRLQISDVECMFVDLEHTPEQALDQDCLLVLDQSVEFVAEDEHFVLGLNSSRFLVVYPGDQPACLDAARVLQQSSELAPKELDAPSPVHGPPLLCEMLAHCLLDVGHFLLYEVEPGPFLQHPLSQMIFLYSLQNLPGCPLHLHPVLLLEVHAPTFDELFDQGGSSLLVSIPLGIELLNSNYLAHVVSILHHLPLLDLATNGLLDHQSHPLLLLVF